MTQEDLSLLSGISTKHLSFLENGRSSPSRLILEFLSESFGLEVSEKVELFKLAGFHYELTKQKPLLPRESLTHLLRAHNPFPAFVVDDQWNILLANDALMDLLQGIDEELLVQPMNAFKLVLHPRGLAPRILNFSQWRSHLLKALEQLGLSDLKTEVESLSFKPSATIEPSFHDDEFFPLRLKHRGENLSFLTTVMKFNSPEFSGISLETLLPMDQLTRDVLLKN